MIPSIYTQRLKNIKRDYQSKLDIAKRSNNSIEYYVYKLKDIYDEMNQISINEELPAKIRAEKIIEMLKIFETYTEKYQESVMYVQNIAEEFDKEVEKIKTMILQSNPKLDPDEIDKTMSEYIITNSV